VKKKKNPVALAKLRCESLTEGTCAQTLHIGPCSEEGPTIEKVHDFIRAQGAKLVGKHQCAAATWRDAFYELTPPCEKLRERWR
jgi:hypothetical protein